MVGAAGGRRAELATPAFSAVKDSKDPRRPRRECLKTLVSGHAGVVHVISMDDLLFVALLIGFFGLSVVFVHACERILGVDEPEVVEIPESDAQVAA